MKKEVKSVAAAVQEVVEGKKNSIEIHLYESPIITVQDIAGYQINGDWLAIMTKDGQTLVYPSRNISFVRHYSE